MVVITDEANVVKCVALIPGTQLIPDNWHCYFPVTEALPREGDTFLPNVVLQPWLNLDDQPLSELKDVYPSEDYTQFMEALKRGDHLNPEIIPYHVPIEEITDDHL